MSSTTIKDLRLSQPKVGMNSGGDATPTIPHQKTLHDDGGIVVTFDIPGIDPETVNVQCESNHLTVSCAQGTSMVPLDPATDVSKIEADIKWGRLTVTIPAPVIPPIRSIKVNLHDTLKKAESKSTHKPAAKEFTTAE
jgi:HSP20 family molecular chaperone IbpA